MCACGNPLGKSFKLLSKYPLHKREYIFLSVIPVLYSNFDLSFSYMMLLQLSECLVNDPNRFAESKSAVPVSVASGNPHEENVH